MKVINMTSLYACLGGGLLLLFLFVVVSEGHNRGR